MSDRQDVCWFTALGGIAEFAGLENDGPEVNLHGTWLWHVAYIVTAVKDVSRAEEPSFQIWRHSSPTEPSGSLNDQILVTDLTCAAFSVVSAIQVFTTFLLIFTLLRHSSYNCIVHARNGHISTSGLKYDVTIVFFDPNFLPFGGSNVCANFGENQSRNATVRVLADGQTDRQTQTDFITCPMLYVIAKGQIILKQPRLLTFCNIYAYKGYLGKPSL